MGKRLKTTDQSIALAAAAHFDPHIHAPAYNTRFEHDACGMGFVADLSGRDTHKILDDALRCLERLAHRGAFDADGKSGDGAGILSAIPHTLLNRELERVGQRAHRPGDVAVGMMFLPRATEANAAVRRIINDELSRRQLPVLMWRTVQLEPNALGKRAQEMCPDIQQVIIERPTSFASELAFDQHLFLIRRCIEKAVQAEKDRGLLCRLALLPHSRIQGAGLRAAVAPLLHRPQRHRFQSQSLCLSSALLHKHLSDLGTRQPFRFLGHNGEINTVEGNQTWMRAREADLDSLVWGAEIENIKPDHRRNQQRHRPARQRRRAADAGRPRYHARAQDADPAAVGERPGHVARGQKLFSISLGVDGAVGRPGLDRLLRRLRDRPRRSIATACARRATSRRAMASSMPAAKLARSMSNRIASR